MYDNDVVKVYSGQSYSLFITVMLKLRMYKVGFMAYLYLLTVSPSVGTVTPFTLWPLLIIIKACTLKVH